MAIHAPITGALLRAPLQPTFCIANRAEIEEEIERLIGLLDAAEPDCDLEPEEDCAVDDARCDVSCDDLLPIAPRYAADQSLGPINEREGNRAWHRRMMGERA